MAQKAVEDAIAEETKLSAELADLEAMFGPGGPAAEPDDAMHSLKSHLTSVLQHLEPDKCVDPALIALAESHSAQLLQGFRVTLDEAAKLQAQQGDTQPRHRLVGESTVIRRVTAAKGERMRMVGRQPEKIRKIGGFFGAASNASTPPGGAPSDANASSGGSAGVGTSGA